MSASPDIDTRDRAVIGATQAGLRFCHRPFAAVAAETGLDEEEALARIAKMKDRGIIRRIAAVPNHYALGLSANGMSVWDVADDRMAEFGPRVGELDFVTHCYRRPRLENWPYNLFAMVHGKTRADVESKVAAIAAILGQAARSHEVLYSTRILKKTGFRLTV